ncbi:MAG: 3'(2'),5'-bisphosphate nucleotidase CysQ [Gammaproteobacteria bacterium]
MNTRNGYADLIELLERLVRRASEAILAIYGEKDFVVNIKADASPLTAADLASHHILDAGLKELNPELPVLSEENATHYTAAQRQGWTRYWLVDPLDGTKEFVKRNGEFTINVALIEFGRPVLGIVHVPIEGTSYIGGVAGPAKRRDKAGIVNTLHTSDVARQRAVRIVGSRSHAGGELEGFAAALGRHEFLAVGSALKFCLVAEGRADVYLRLKPTSEWDTAAGQAVLEAAGGAVTDLNGNPLRYNTRTTLINPSFLACGDRSRDYTSAARKAA